MLRVKRRKVVTNKKNNNRNKKFFPISNSQKKTMKCLTKTNFKTRWLQENYSKDGSMKPSQPTKKQLIYKNFNNDFRSIMKFLFRWLEDYSYSVTENRISDFLQVFLLLKNQGKV